MGNFGIKIDLLKLKNSFVTNLKGKAATKRCLVIPIDDSGVYLGEKGVYLNLTAVEMREQRYGDTHVLKQSLAKEVYQAMSEEERMAQPIFGALKPIKANSGKWKERRLPTQQRQSKTLTTSRSDIRRTKARHNSGSNPRFVVLPEFSPKFKRYDNR